MTNPAPYITIQGGAKVSTVDTAIVYGDDHLLYPGQVHAIFDGVTNVLHHPPQ